MSGLHGASAVSMVYGCVCFAHRCSLSPYLRRARHSANTLCVHECPPPLELLVCAPTSSNRTSTHYCKLVHDASGSDPHPGRSGRLSSSCSAVHRPRARSLHAGPRGEKLSLRTLSVIPAILPQRVYAWSGVLLALLCQIVCICTMIQRASRDGTLASARATSTETEGRDRNRPGRDGVHV